MNVEKYIRFPDILKSLKYQKSVHEGERSTYLETYLGYLQAKCYVVEEDYIDSGHLKDYASYYSLRGDGVGKRTIRLHFFSKDVEQIESGFEYLSSRALAGEVDEYLNEGYLGFVVVRPLNETAIGRTCLRVYGDGAQASWHRHFPLLREYKVTVGGMRLSVRSVAFQEQDNEIAACSATSIWHTLHALPHRITTQQIESLFQISNAASTTDRQMPAPGETVHRFPTTGLNADQIQNYLQSKGIDCLVRGFSGKTRSTGLLEYVQTFCGAGTPMILVGRLHASANKYSDYSIGELHAITVLGYSENLERQATGAASENIGKLYVHDDTLGPFARYEVELPDDNASFAKFLPENLRDKTSLNSAQHLFTKSGLKYRRFLPVYAIVPIDEGVRYPYENVATFAKTFSEIIAGQLDTGQAHGPRPQIEWAVRLQHGTQFKVSLRGMGWLDPEVRADLLERSLDYVWVAEFNELFPGGVRERRLTAVFDANQLRQDGALIAFFASGTDAMRASYEALIAKTLNAWDAGRNRETFPSTIHAVLNKLATVQRDETLIPYAPPVYD